MLLASAGRASVKAFIAACVLLMIEGAPLARSREGSVGSGPLTRFEHSEHTATLLQDGRRVLVFGGDSEDVSHAEIWRIDAKEWTDAGQSHHTMEGHTATLLADGRVLVTGGGANECCGDPASRFAELWDPEKRGWKSTAKLHQPRYQHRAVALPDGRVLVIGGTRIVGDPPMPLASAEAWDPKTGQWTLVEPMLKARYAHTATLLNDGLVLVTGGISVGGIINSAEIFDPKIGHWQMLSPMANRRCFHEAIGLPDGRVLVAGGNEKGGAAEIWDPATALWSTAGQLLSPRSSFTATLLPSGEVLVAGGRDERRHGQVSLVELEIWSPQTSRWRSAGQLAIDRVFHTATLLPDGRVLFVGGKSSSYETEIWAPQGWKGKSAAK